MSSACAVALPNVNVHAGLSHISGYITGSAQNQMRWLRMAVIWVAAIALCPDLGTDCTELGL